MNGKRGGGAGADWTSAVTVAIKQDATIPMAVEGRLLVLTS